MSAGPNVALANLVIQAVLIAGALTGAYLAERRRFGNHCLLMRTLVGVEIVAVGVIMAPSLARYLMHWGGFSTLDTEIVIHAVLGGLLLCLWIFINLALLGVVRTPGRLRRYMWTALMLWLITLALGIQQYLRIWTSTSRFWLYGIPLLVLAATGGVALLMSRSAASTRRPSSLGGSRSG